MILLILAVVVIYLLVGATILTYLTRKDPMAKGIWKELGVPFILFFPAFLLIVAMDEEDFHKIFTKQSRRELDS